VVPWELAELIHIGEQVLTQQRNADLVTVQETQEKLKMEERESDTDLDQRSEHDDSPYQNSTKKYQWKQKWG
jgi:NH3-dependent NAD+ synthetase